MGKECPVWQDVVCTAFDDKEGAISKSAQAPGLGAVPEPQCDVKDTDGVHCPDKPTVFLKIDNRELILCKRCYKAFLAEAWH